MRVLELRIPASDTFQADVGIEGGKIKQLGQGLGPAAKEIDASGKYLIPGGVDVHTHVDLKLMGHQSDDDFYSGTVAAACGGVTTIVDYAMPEAGQSIRGSIESWIEKAKGKAYIDYGFHPAKKLSPKLSGVPWAAKTSSLVEPIVKYSGVPTLMLLGNIRTFNSL
jgi:dihydroorotase-like cyclic amidohydrolase